EILASRLLVFDSRHGTSTTAKNQQSPLAALRMLAGAEFKPATEEAAQEAVAQLGNLNNIRNLRADVSVREGLLSVRINGRPQLHDLSPLRTLPIHALDLSACQIDNLSGIAGIPLRRLNVSGTRVEDLTPLRGMPLQELDLAGTPVEDLSDLALLPI